MNPIDFSKIRWGTFTRAAKEHGAPSVKMFAKEVLQNPDDFSNRMRKKAQFYENVIAK